MQPTVKKKEKQNADQALCFSVFSLIQIAPWLGFLHISEINPYSLIFVSELFEQLQLLILSSSFYLEIKKK